VGSSKVRRANVRVLAATNANIAREVAEGRFREDLLYRLNTFEIHLPPLRERREDIPHIAATFLARHAARYGGQVPQLAPSAMQALLDHRWPGNIRELEHVIERACLMAQGAEIEAHDLLLRPRGAGESIDEMSLEDAERTVIRRELRRAGGNVTEAARALGMSRSALYRRLQHFGIKVTE
jgi:DNA-binding NtrC family response regulator